MESQFLQEVRAYANEMAARLPKTKEGGIIILAADSVDVLQAIISEPANKKAMLKNLINNADVQQILMEIIGDDRD